MPTALSLAVIAGALAVIAGALAASPVSAGVPAPTAGTNSESVRLAAAQAATSVSDTYRLVVLGDSVSVGYEPNVTNWNDIYGYGDRLYEQALLHGRSEMSNYAIAGLTTEGLINLLQGAKDKKKLTISQIQDFSQYPDERVAQLASDVGSRTPELNESLKQADAVALTIGGNDFLDYVKNLLEEDPKDAIAQLDAEIDGLLNNYTIQAKQAVELLHELAPNAVIKLTDQYLPMPVQYDADLYADLIGVTDKLAGLLDQLEQGLDAQDVPLDIVHIRSLFAGKEMSLTHIYYDKDVHPNQTGYAAIARQFSDSLWHSYTSIPAADKTKNGTALAPAIYINGKSLSTPNQPMLKNSTTFLALRDVADATGALVQWDSKTQTATFTKGANKVVIAIGSKTMTVNGIQKELTTAAYLQKVGSEQKTYVPLAAIATGLQYQVVYRSKLNTAFINS
ncbi:stalk domain-containing protein [Cohnella fermenti]|nr:stalk domain-containing protein [Cohnella fermenti]